MMSKITPEQYRKIINELELDGIAMIKLNSYIKYENLSPKMNISIKDTASYQNSDNGFVVENKYTLTSKNKDNIIGIKIEAIYLITFKSINEIDDDFFNVYKSISLPLNVWPFFRELVNSMTSRMSIRPLSLPLIKR
ncbi:hypothetical protein GF407_16520 [candidate division KSB1 bacterium]|nr:hypothetical protein [candidate division KSB1 bacterium]